MQVQHDLLLESQTRRALLRWRSGVLVSLAGLTGVIVWVVVRWLDGDPSNDFREPSGLSHLMPVVFLGLLAVALAGLNRLLDEARSGRLVSEGMAAVRLAETAGLSRAEALERAVLGLGRRVERLENWLQLGASLLLTLGLVGTAGGLVAALGGLGASLDALDGSGVDRTGFSAGVSAALSGMSTAFLTTLVGAVLGGVALRVLAELARELGEAILEVLEVRLLALLAREGGE